MATNTNSPGHKPFSTSIEGNSHLRKTSQARHPHSSDSSKKYPEQATISTDIDSTGLRDSQTPNNETRSKSRMDRMRANRWVPPDREPNMRDDGLGLLFGPIFQIYAIGLLTVVVAGFCVAGYAGLTYFTPIVMAWINNWFNNRPTIQQMIQKIYTPLLLMGASVSYVTDSTEIILVALLFGILITGKSRLVIIIELAMPFIFKEIGYTFMAFHLIIALMPYPLRYMTILRMRLLYTPDYRLRHNTDQPHYVTYVLGSGGHTAEMNAIIENSFRGGRNTHRRYIISKGDENSAIKARRIEVDTLVSKLRGDASKGSYDICFVTRAREVHQSWLSTPETALLCIRDVVRVFRTPAMRRDHAGFHFPNVVVTNGPGSGFIVAIVAISMRILGICPLDYMQVVFIESFTKVSTLSLTGKLFHYTGLADVFLVQHAPVAERYGKVNAGYLVASSTEDTH